MKLKQAYLTGFLLFALAADTWARGGGGGGGSGGGGGHFGSFGHRSTGPMRWIDWLVYGFAFIFVFGLGWLQKYRISKKQQRVSQTLQRIAVTERVWDEALLCGMIRKSFVQLQTAWSNQDVHLLQTLLHPVLFPDWLSQIDMMIAKGERNVLGDFDIKNLAIIDVQNYQDNERDCFTVCIDAYVDDVTVDSSGKKARDQTGLFREFWTYEWHDGAWRLLAVSQKNKWQKFVDAPIIDEGRSPRNKKVS